MQTTEGVKHGTGLGVRGWEQEPCCGSVLWTQPQMHDFPRAVCQIRVEGMSQCKGCSVLCFSVLTGTVMTPNYIDSSSLSVAPWCDCSNSGNDIDECQKFLNFFQDNICLSEYKIRCLLMCCRVFSGIPLLLQCVTTHRGITLHFVERGCVVGVKIKRMSKYAWLLWFMVKIASTRSSWKNKSKPKVVWYWNMFTSQVIFGV